MAELLVLILISLVFSVGVSFFFDQNRNILLIFCASSFLAAIVNLIAANALGKYERIIFLGPLTEESCRFLAILLLGRMTLMRPGRWVAGLGFWSLEGFAKGISFVEDKLLKPQSLELIALRGEAVFTSAMLHVLIASVVLALWSRSKVLAFFAGLAIHVCHNGAVAYVAARIPLQHAVWLVGWPFVYLLVCLTCFARYDEQSRLSRTGLPIS